MISTKSKPRLQADSAWKDVLEYFFKNIIEMMFSDLFIKIDWAQGWTFLDKEMQKISALSKVGARNVDKLVKVFLLDGEVKWLLLHFEIQGNRDINFEERMYIYNYRIFDKYKIHPVSCAILIDGSYSWRPNSYEFNQLGCEIYFKFHTLKLIDLKCQRDILESSNNPLASIILVQLDTIQSKKDVYNNNYLLKLSHAKKLLKKGFDKELVLQIYNFLDRLMVLPTDLEIQYQNDIIHYEEENQMAYVNSIERFAMKRGLEQGLKQGLEQGLEQGLRQGLEQGRQQADKMANQIKYKIALALFKKGQSIDLISEVSGLTHEELLALQSNNDSAKK